MSFLDYQQKYIEKLELKVTNYGKLVEVLECYILEMSHKKYSSSNWDDIKTEYLESIQKLETSIWGSPITEKLWE